MSQPMLTLKSGTPSNKATAHLLPCRIHHDGSVEPTESFWAPKPNKSEKDTTSSASSTAYFRGRKLHGKTVTLPEGYRGVVAATVSEVQARPEEADVEVIDVDAQLPQGTLQVQAEFDEMVVWEHEATADAGGDPYVRGVEEWLALAEQIHSYPAPDSKEK